MVDDPEVVFIDFEIVSGIPCIRVGCFILGERQNTSGKGCNKIQGETLETLNHNAHSSPVDPNDGYSLYVPTFVAEEVGLIMPPTSP